MGHYKDFVPAKDAEFDVFFKNYCQYVNGKCAGQSPEWTHIPEARREDLNTAYADWYTAYSKLKQPHTSSDILAKDLARKRDEKTLREFNNEFIVYSSAVTPEEKKDLGNHPRDPHPTPVPTPTAQVEADIVLPGPHLIELRIKELASLAAEADRANHGVRIYWGVLESLAAGVSSPAKGQADKFYLASPPVSGDDLPHSDFTRKKRYRFDFPGEDRGKTVYFCLRYENSKGEPGPWGPVLSAIIP
jgi:hypothetical protein